MSDLPPDPAKDDMYTRIAREVAEWAAWSEANRPSGPAPAIGWQPTPFDPVGAEVYDYWATRMPVVAEWQRPDPDEEHVRGWHWLTNPGPIDWVQLP